MLPLKPDPDAARDLAVRSLTRAAITTGLAAIDRNVRPAEFIEKTWPEDDGVGLAHRRGTSQVRERSFFRYAGAD